MRVLFNTYPTAMCMRGGGEVQLSGCLFRAFILTAGGRCIALFARNYVSSGEGEGHWRDLQTS